MRPERMALLRTTIIVLAVAVAVAVVVAPPPALPREHREPKCRRRCGDMEIPFPFGIDGDPSPCYYDENFRITCNSSFTPHKAFLNTSTGEVEVADIGLDGQLRIMQYPSSDCSGTRMTREMTKLNFTSLKIFTISDTRNNFTAVGCDTSATVKGIRIERPQKTAIASSSGTVTSSTAQTKGSPYTRGVSPGVQCGRGQSYGSCLGGGKDPRRLQETTPTDTFRYATGCMSLCTNVTDVVNGSCSGVGCCRTSIPHGLMEMMVTVNSTNNYEYVQDFNPCSFASIVEDGKFNFSSAYLSGWKETEKLPLVLDWAIGDNVTCDVAKRNDRTFACGEYTTCSEPNNNSGYRCACWPGFAGNPYLLHGCQDIDECARPDFNQCVNHCKNTEGSYGCSCPKGYHGDGKKDGSGCKFPVIEVAVGAAMGVLILIAAAFCLYYARKKRQLMEQRRKFFEQNGGLMLDLKCKGSSAATQTFTEEELKKATKNYAESRMIGRGGHGFVYKGFLADKTKVAVKKSTEVDPSQIEQFINEVAVLSQVKHENVVKLLGCCLETEVPILVYEFISNGTLSEHIHDKTKTFRWETRLKIAAETAGALSHLHSAPSFPIIHRDVKSANILLDDDFNAKVSDFGASRLVPMDPIRVLTRIQGTPGYLDPEYLQTNQLTEKSDVYSFGVVLLELFTGKRVISKNKNLAQHFLEWVKNGGTLECFENQLANGGNVEQIKEIAELVISCIRMRGDERPSMQEVAMKLDKLNMTVKHSSINKEIDSKETEQMPAGKPETGKRGGDDSGSVDFDSATGIQMPESEGGR